MTDQSRPLVTIGICTYNRADSYLGAALQSAVDQTYPTLEIVVSDNASVDHTEELVRSFEDPRIRYFKQERNLGVNGNFNFALEQARGAYFLLLHDDDLIDPDFCETCMNAAGDNTNYGLLRTGTRIIDADGEVIAERPNDAEGLPPAEFFLAWFADKTAFYLPSTLFNTQRLKELGGFQSKTELFQDVVASVRLATRYGRVDVRDVKASFRKHGSNSGAAQAVERWCEDSLHVLDVMCEEMPESEARLRNAGLPYFTRTNYRHTRAIESPIERAKMYWWVYQRCGYRYSPLRFILPGLVRRQIRRVGRVVKPPLASR